MTDRLVALRQARGRWPTTSLPRSTKLAISEARRSGEVLRPSKAPTGPAPPRRSVCAPGTMSLHPNADRRREAMFTFKAEGTVAQGARRRIPRKLMVVGAFVVCALGAFAIGRAWATPPVGFTSTNLVGPVTVDEFDSMAQADDWKARFKTK